MRAIGAAQAKVEDRAGAAKTFEKALQTAARIQKPADEWDSLREIAEAQAEAGDILGAFKTMRSILDEPTRAQSLRAIARAQVKVGDIQGALQTAAGYRDDSVKDSALGDIAVAQYKTGNVRGSLETVAGIPSSSGKVEVLITVAKAQAKAGDRAGATKTVEQAFQIAAEVRSDPKLVGILNGFACMDAAAIGDMKALEQASRTAALIQESDKRKDPLLSHIMSHQLGAGEIQRAVRTAARIRGERTKAQALIGSARAQLKGGDRAGALETVEQALQTAALIRESDQGKDGVLRNIAVAQAETGDIQGAMQTAAGIRGKDNKGEVLKAIAHAHAKSGDIAGAHALAASQSSPFVRANALLGMAEGILERKDAEQSQVVSTKP